MKAMKAAVQWWQLKKHIMVNDKSVKTIEGCDDNRGRCGIYWTLLKGCDCL